MPKKTIYFPTDPTNLSQSRLFCSSIFDSTHLEDIGLYATMIFLHCKSIEDFKKYSNDSVENIMKILDRLIAKNLIGSEEV